MESSYHPPNQIQARLLRLAGLFLVIYSIALTISPAARARTWTVDLRWSHWIGLVMWIAAVLAAHWQLSRRAPDADPYLLPAASLLAGWGLLTIWRLDAGFGLRQALWLLLCVGILVAALGFPGNLDILGRYKYIFLMSGLLLTALTLLLGTNPGGNGPRLWLGCCGIYIQPSEPLKLLLLVYLAAFFAGNIPIRTRLMPLLLPSLFLTGLALAILLIQRDLGTASIFIFLYAAQVYIATGKRRLLLAALGMLLVAGLVGYFFVDIIRFRLTAWLDPWSDPSGRSYQVIQSILAVANGGLYGRGPGLGSPSLVPVAHSDFIFTSIAEETGLIGSLALLVLVGLVVTRGFLVAMRAGSNFRRLLAAGIATYFGAQSVLIIGGNLRLLPLTGVTLPFVSYGGSSLLTSFIGLAILLQISNEVDTEPAWLQQPKPYLSMAALIGIGLAGCALANGWWAAVRADDLLARTDNPRRTIADRFVLRGSLLDRQNRAINITTGQPGGYARQYHVPDLSSITGYTHPVYGQAGLEASLDPYLRGLQGNPALLIWWDHVLYGQPPMGLNIRLTLDLDIQKRADELLGRNSGALVLVNASTGEILAIASHPSFDASQLDNIGVTLSQAPGSPLLNRATQGKYPFDPLLPTVEQAAFGGIAPTQTNLVNLFDQLGFYRLPQINLPAAEPPVQGSLTGLLLSPAQAVIPAAAISNQGICPPLQIASAVNTPAAGWVVLNPAGEPVQCLPSEGAVEAAKSFQEPGQQFWGVTTVSGAGKPQPVTWFMGGTQPNWTGTPLALVVVLEENAPDLAAYIGQTLLQKAINP